MILPLRADNLGWEVWQGPDPFPHLLDQHRGTPDDHDHDDDDDQHRWTPGHFYDNDDCDDGYYDQGHQITIMMIITIMVIIISFCWCFSAALDPFSTFVPFLMIFLASSNKSKL